MTQIEQASESGPVLPRDTTPTWEMELLVSGATILGLLQLPGLLDRGYTHLFNSSSEAYSGLLSAMWIYCKFSLLTLIITFIVHLCLRGYWVALVGMNSVYPGGIDWDKLRMGPIARRVNRERSPAISAAIEAADNRATQVFGTGFGIAMIMLLPIMLVLVGLLVATATDLIVGPGYAKHSFFAVVTLVLLPSMVAITIDRQLGRRLDPAKWPARALARVIAGNRRIGLDGSSNLLVGLFISHEGTNRARWWAIVFLVPITLVVMASAVGMRRELQFGISEAWPRTDAFNPRSAQAGFYDSQRAGRSHERPLPYIPDRVATGAYLPLFIPFIPRLDAPALARACPATRSRAPGLDSTLDCLGRVADVRIDGVPVSVQLDASSDPRSGQRGMLAMLPIASLAPGRHELSLNAPSRPKSKDAGKRYRIPFWK